MSTINIGMEQPYLTVSFKLSPEAWSWAQEITKPMVQDYQDNAPLSAALITPEPDMIQAWKESKAYAEINAFTKTYGLEDGEVNFFIYKSLNAPLEDPRGNPHIDTTGPDRYTGDKYDIPIRFNILLSGDEDQEMFWWNCDRDHWKVRVAEFPRPNGVPAKRLQAKGGVEKSRAGQYKLLGEPDFKCNTLAKLNQKSSFVRTDILHSINWDGKSPRLLLSIRFQQPWANLKIPS